MPLRLQSKRRTGGIAQPVFFIVYAAQNSADASF